MLQGYAISIFYYFPLLYDEYEFRNTLRFLVLILATDFRKYSHTMLSY